MDDCVYYLYFKQGHFRTYIVIKHNLYKCKLLLISGLYLWNAIASWHLLVVECIQPGEIWGHNTRSDVKLLCNLVFSFAWVSGGVVFESILNSSTMNQWVQVNILWKYHNQQIACVLHITIFLGMSRKRRLVKELTKPSRSFKWLVE